MTQELIWVVLIKIFWYSRDLAERRKLFISWVFLFWLLLKIFVCQGYPFPLTLSTQCIILWDHPWLLWHSLPHKQQEELQGGNKLQKQKESEETKSYFHKYISRNRIKRTIKRSRAGYIVASSPLLYYYFPFAKVQNLQIFRHMTCLCMHISCLWDAQLLGWNKKALVCAPMCL